jgi:cytidine deaminase
MTKISDAALRRLEKAARAAARNAYAPYSHFPVGAAVLGKTGKVYSGCNVENASYGLCACAERAAVCAAVAAGERSIRAVAVYTPTPLPTAPCGACRQVIHEFGADTLVVSFCDSRTRIDTRISALLPAAFGPGDLA